MSNKRTLESLHTRAGTLGIEYVPIIYRLSKKDILFIKQNSSKLSFEDINKELSVKLTSSQYGSFLRKNNLKGRGRSRKLSQKEKEKHSEVMKKLKSKTFTKEEVEEWYNKLSSGVSLASLKTELHLDRTTIKNWIIYYGYDYTDCLLNSNVNKQKKVECIESHKIYSNVREAAQDLKKEKLNVLIVQIRAACTHRTHTAAGYHWRYVDEEN